MLNSKPARLTMVSTLALPNESLKWKDKKLRVKVIIQVLISNILSSPHNMRKYTAALSLFPECRSKQRTG